MVLKARKYIETEMIDNTNNHFGEWIEEIKDDIGFLVKHEDYISFFGKGKENDLPIYSLNKRKEITEQGNVRTITEVLEAYLMNDKGQTIERLI